MNRCSLIWTALLALTLPVAAPAAGKDVSPQDWSYIALRDFAGRGLVHGYRDASFLGDRSLTRFEMASLVKRVLDRLLELTPDPGAVPSTAASRGLGLEEPPTGKPVPAARPVSFREADLATVRRLSGEYSVELALIGADLQAATERMEKLEGRVDQIEKSLRDPEGPLQTALSKASRADKVRLSGYLQARYQSYQHTNEKATPSRGTPVTDTFLIRRMRLSLLGRPSEKIGVFYQLDGAGSSVNTRDAWIDYFFQGNPAKGPTATIGLFKAPFGFENVQSSSIREHPERGRIIRFLFPDERDRGVKLTSSTSGSLVYVLAVQNGLNQGSRLGNTEDNNNNKDVIGRIRTSTLGGKLDAGASILFGSTMRTVRLGDDTAPISAANPRENAKMLLGGDFQWYVVDGTLVRAEWVRGKVMGTHAGGYILQLIQNVGKKDQAVVKYDWFGIDDNALVQRGPVATPLGSPAEYAGTLSALSLGWVHHLDRSTRLKLFYEWNRRGTDQVNGAPFQWLGNVLRFEVISLF